MKCIVDHESCRICRKFAKLRKNVGFLSHMLSVIAKDPFDEMKDNNGKMVK